MWCKIQVHVAFLNALHVTKVFFTCAFLFHPVKNMWSPFKVIVFCVPFWHLNLLCDPVPVLSCGIASQKATYANLGARVAPMWMNIALLLWVLLCLASDTLSMAPDRTTVPHSVWDVGMWVLLNPALLLEAEVCAYQRVSSVLIL